MTIDIDPVIVRFGHLALGWYGLAVALGIGVALVVTQREARRRGIDTDALWSVAAWAVAGGFIGARLLHVLDRWPDYAADPLRILALQRGGLAIEGALIGGLGAGVVAARRHGLPVLGLADSAGPGLLLGQAIGRLGCLVTGDALGPSTSLPWGVTYLNPDSMAPAQGVSFQPVFAYEALWDLAAFALVWTLRARVKRPGAIFATYLAVYAVGKFAITFLRQERIWLWGLQEAQLLAVALVVLAAVIWLHGGRSDVDSSSPAARPRGTPTAAP